MDWSTLAAFADKFGIPVTLLVLFIYLDIKRRKKEDTERSELGARLNSVEDYQRTRLESLVVESNEVHREIREVADRMVKVTEGIGQSQRTLTAAIGGRPCLRQVVTDIRAGEAGK